MHEYSYVNYNYVALFIFVLLLYLWTNDQYLGVRLKNQISDWLIEFGRGPSVDFCQDLPLNKLTRVGENISIKILIPISLRINTPDGEQNSEAEDISNRIISESSVEITPTELSVLPEENKVPYIKEVEVYDNNPHSNSGKCDILYIKFVIKKTGTYGFNVKYGQKKIKGSLQHYYKYFAPSCIDAETTSLIKNSPSITCIVSKSTEAIIEPKDRFGNSCLYEDIDTSCFSFQLEHVDESYKDFSVITKCDFSKLLYYKSQKKSRLKLNLLINSPGIFKGHLYYNKSLIKNGTIDIISLASDENSILQNNLRSNSYSPGSVYKEAKLLVYGPDVQKKVRQVYIYISPISITVKEFYFNIIPRVLSKFKIIPATKIKHLFLNDETKCSTLEITEKGKYRITIDVDQTNARILMSMFNYYLGNRLGGTVSFENKKKLFYEELKKIHYSYQRMNIFSFTFLKISRDSLITSTLNETRYFTYSDWAKNFKISFKGEEGVDGGGLRKEWLDLLCLKIFNNDLSGMFCSFGNSRFVHPNHDRSDKWTYKYYELAGKIVGKCLFESSIGSTYVQPVNARFSRSFLSQMIGFPPHYTHFVHDDPEFYSSKIKYILESDSIESMDLTFTEEEYSSNGKLIKTVDLIPNGSLVKVTNENKLEYLNALAEYRLCKRVQKEINAFLKGLHELVNENLLSNFDENELEIIMCGKSEFKLKDLQDNCIVTDFGFLRAKLLRWFWASIENMTEEERASLLQFTTGCSILPQGGFKHLNPKFRISINPTRDKLPIAHSCFSQICISDHNSFEDFDKALKIAINEGSEGYAFL